MPLYMIFILPFFTVLGQFGGGGGGGGGGE